MRTNKACPLYTGPGGAGASTDNAPPPVPASAVLAGTIYDTSSAHSQGQDAGGKKLDDSLDDGDKSLGLDESEELINVDGTKIKLSSKVMKVGHVLSEGEKSRQKPPPSLFDK